jgi:hypothetical protein
MDENTRKEAIGVMCSGAKQVIDGAKRQWMSGAYGTDADMVRDNLERWNVIDHAVSRLAKELRAAE